MSVYYVSIDPGIEGTGWAVWDAGDEWNMVARPVETGVIFPGRRKGDESDFVSKSDRVIKKLHVVVKSICPKKVWCEFPKLMESNYAATASGNIFKLAYFVGRVNELCSAYGTFIPVDVNDWKGQMPKPAVDARIARLLRNAEYPDHASDAVGIGLWAKGVWTNGKNSGTSITRLRPAHTGE